MRKDKHGDWFLPNSKISLPGRLLIDEVKKSIILKLYCSTLLDGNLIKINDYNTRNNYEIILGNALDELTLYNCLFRSLIPIGESFYELCYRIDFVFFNVHFKKITDILICKSEAIFPYLSSFFDGRESMKFNFHEKEEISYSEPMSVNDNLNFILVDEYFKNSKNFSGGYELKYNKSIQFSYNKNTNIFKVLIDLSKFSSFLSFVTNKSINYNLKYIYVESNEFILFNKFSNSKNGLYEIQVLNFTLNSLHIDQDDYIHQNNFLISKWHFFDNEINNIIAKWYSNFRLSAIYDFYIDSNYWFEGKNVTISNVMYNNKFLNLAQALESYFDNFNINIKITNEEFTKKRQLALNSIESQELKKWIEKNLKFPKTIDYVDKLEFLVNNFKEIFEQDKKLFEFSKLYPKEAKDFRHKLSHGRIEKTYQGEQFDKVFSFSKILMCFCILESLEIDKKRILTIFKISYYLRNELNKITKF